MSKNTPFSIGGYFSDFVETQVKEGRYSSASDVVRDALRLLEEQEAKLAASRAALIEGEQSGAFTPFDFEAFIARKRAARSSTLRADFDRLEPLVGWAKARACAPCPPGARPLVGTLSFAHPTS
jgi:antitoxin ParD1/3/4